jgi:hypothetical protein
MPLIIAGGKIKHPQEQDFDIETIIPGIGDMRGNMRAVD